MSKIELVEKFNVVTENGEDDRVMLYQMTANSMPKTPFKEYIDRPFKVSAYVKFMDAEKNKQILSIYTSESVVLSGDSKTLADSLDELIDTFSHDIIEYYVEIKAAQSKNNRTFLTLCLSDSKVHQDA